MNLCNLVYLVKCISEFEKWEKILKGDANGNYKVLFEIVKNKRRGTNNLKYLKDDVIFPSFFQGRIKKIMQTDEEVGKVAQAVPVIIYILYYRMLLQQLSVQCTLYRVFQTTQLL